MEDVEKVKQLINSVEDMENFKNNLQIKYQDTKENNKVHISDKEIILRNTLFNLKTLNNDKHKIKGTYYIKDKEINNLYIDNLYINPSIFKDEKYKKLVLKRKAIDSLCGSITALLMSTAGFCAAYTYDAKPLYLSSVLMSLSAFLNLQYYLSNKGYTLNDKMSDYKLDKFKEYLEEDLKQERMNNIKIYEESQNFINNKLTLIENLINMYQTDIDIYNKEIDELTNDNTNLKRYVKTKRLKNSLKV